MQEKKQFLFLTVMFGFLIINISANSKSPKIYLVRKEIALGAISPSKKAPFTVEFENRGNTALIITDVRTSCGCTTARLAKKEYKAGEKGIIKGAFNPHNYSGNVVKTITIRSNDPINTRVIVRLRANVIVPITVNPRTINFKKVFYGSKTEAFFILKGSNVKNFQIKKIKIPDSLNFITYKIENIGNNTINKYKVKLFCNPISETFNKFSGNLSVVTDVRENPVIRVVVKGEVIPPIECAPARINSAVRNHSYFSFPVTISSSEDFKIRKVEIKLKTGQKLRYKIVKNINRHNYTVILYSLRLLTGRIEGEMLITTTNDIQKNIKIPIRVNIY